MGRAITIGLPLVIFVSSVDVSIRAYNGAPSVSLAQVVISWIMLAMIVSMMRNIVKTQREIDAMDKKRGTKL